MKRYPIPPMMLLGLVLPIFLLAGCGEDATKKRHATNAEEYFNRGGYDREAISTPGPPVFRPARNASLPV